MNTFTIAAEAELFITPMRAHKLAAVVRKWGYRASVWARQSRDDCGWVVVVSSNNGFEGFAHAV